MGFLNFFRKSKNIQLEENCLELTTAQLIARDILLNKAAPLDKTGVIDDKITGIDSNCEKIVSAIIISDFSDIKSNCNRVAISLARQIALMCHYPNFNEKDGSNRTKITIIDINPNNNLDAIFDALKVETGNLSTLCHWTIQYPDGTTSKNDNAKAFIDIEFNILNLNPTDLSSYIDSQYSHNEIISIFYNNYCLNGIDSNRFLQCYNFSNDSNAIEPNLKRAKLANMIYQKSINLTAIKDISNINAYKDPLNRYSKKLKWDIINTEWQKLRPELKLSSLFCVDCFESRIRSANYNICKDNITQLAYTEHARWNVEKLILGYRIFTPEEKHHDNKSFGDEKKEYRINKKNLEKAHIDICSCNELSLINPEDLKYDYFLTLCINEILNRKI